MCADDLPIHLCDPFRPAALRAEALMDALTEETFERKSRMAARFVNAPVVLISLVVADCRFFKSCISLREPWRSLLQTPLPYYFRRHNRVTGPTLLIEDSWTHPPANYNLAIQELKLIAYLVNPLVTCDGYALGLFCVIDSKPGRWRRGRHRHTGLGRSNDGREKIANGNRSLVSSRGKMRQPI
jgi:GAF domain-containing protein